MPAQSEITSVLDRQLLLQFGERLRRARINQGLTTTQVAERAGITRMTLRAVESGEASPTMGSYLRVMGVLGLSKDLALLAADVLLPPEDKRVAASDAPEPLKTAQKRGSKDKHVAATTEFRTAVSASHELQDLQSLVLHEEAVRRMQKHPELVQQALETLRRWRSQGSPRSQFLWDEWSVILHRKTWRRALAVSARSKELRQASPLPTVLPDEVRQRLIREVQALKRGVELGVLANGDPSSSAAGSSRGT